MIQGKDNRRVAIYTRLSLAKEESVSIDRQLKACREHAEARGWTIVGEFVDEGVSAHRNHPSTRKGWKQLTAARDNTKFDTIIVWRLDRFTRRITDFWSTWQNLDADGVALVSVMDHLDMGTPVGRIVAGVVAGFAEMESEAIRDRVNAARAYLLRNGRYVGGLLPYGFRSVPNPAGAGWVIAQHPEEIEVMRQIIDRTLRGRTLYSTKQWLEESGIAPPRGGKTWPYSTLVRLVRNPMMAGMIPNNPGSRSKERGSDVLRDADGLPVIDDSLAVLPVSQWRAMVARLDEFDQIPQRRPAQMKRKTSGVLSGLVFCGEHLDAEGNPTRMWRGTTQGRPSYVCRVCYQTISNFEAFVIEQFLETCGDRIHLRMVEEVVEGGAVQAREASIRLAELGREFVTADAQRSAEIVAQMTRLKQLQEQASRQEAQIEVRPVGGPDQTYAQDWEQAADDETRREILGHAIGRIWVIRGVLGRNTRANKLARMVIEWAPMGQVSDPGDAELATWV